MFQMWADGVFSGGPGQGRDVFDSRPHMTTAKALMVNTAFQYDFSGQSHDRTRVHQGWGFPDVKFSMTRPEPIDGASHHYRRNRHPHPLEVHTYQLDMAGDKPLKATLVYADPPGVPSAAQQRINDLDLEGDQPQRHRLLGEQRSSGGSLVDAGRSGQHGGHG